MKKLRSVLVIVALVLAMAVSCTAIAEGVDYTQGDSCTIRQNDGSKLELDPSGATISSGYFPEEGDTVQITYDLDTMKLLDIQLVSRPD